MSDMIREAFEALDELVEMAVQHHGQVKAADAYRGTVKAALQSSQTATAVPNELREEIQVQALDGVWDKLYDMADERSASDPEEASGIMTAVNFIKGEAARLRASQQE